jgi:hypothetical protein
MFAKVLKYDLRFIAQKWWILAVSVLGGAIPAALLVRMLAADGGEAPLLTALLGVCAAFYLFTYAIVFFCSPAVTALLLYWRFYAHFFSDQGYLTFTLPVKRRTLLLSKLTNEMIWYVANFLLMLVAFFLFAWLAMPATEQYPVLNPIILISVGDIFSSAWRAVGAWTVAYVAEALLLLLAYVLFSSCLVQFCITVGAVIAKRHKLIAGIGIFYGVQAALGTVGQLLLTLLGGLLIEGLQVLLQDATRDAVCGVIALILLIFVLLFGALAVLTYCFTENNLDKKLNLA